MPNRPKCLILTSRTGGGHVSLAESLRDILDPDFTVEIVDPQPKVFNLHYRLVTRYALWLWSAEFGWSDTPRRARIAHRIFTALVRKQLSALVRDLRPDVIITTYVFLSYEVMRVLADLGLTIPLAMLYSDPKSLHKAWLTEHAAAAVLAPTPETYDYALAAGVPSDRLHLVGWPVRAQFFRARDIDRAGVLAELKLDAAKLTIFLQGGGEGAARFAKTIDTVLASSPHLQVILAAGTNASLLQRYGAKPNVHALPFTKEIARFMAAADVVMGKAGPNALFEAVTLGKPFIATAYIPGQEEGTLDFIRRYGLGEVALDADSQRAVLTSLIEDRQRLAAMQASVDKYRLWNMRANESIAPVIRSVVEQSSRPH